MTVKSTPRQYGPKRPRSTDNTAFERAYKTNMDPENPYTIEKRSENDTSAIMLNYLTAYCAPPARKSNRPQRRQTTTKAPLRGTQGLVSNVAERPQWQRFSQTQACDDTLSAMTVNYSSVHMRKRIRVGKDNKLVPITIVEAFEKLHPA